MKILLGYNGTDSAKAALKVAVRYAKAFGAKISVVMSASGGAGESDEEINRRAGVLNEARQSIEAAGVGCEARELVRGLSPGEDLVKFARDNRVDVIFVGIEKRSKTQKIILGSNAQYVILKAPCPVMTVKA